MKNKQSTYYLNCKNTRCKKAFYAHIYKFVMPNLLYLFIFVTLKLPIIYIGKSIVKT